MKSRRGFFSALAGAISGGTASAVTMPPKVQRIELGTNPICKCGSAMTRETRNGIEVFRACCFGDCDNDGKFFEIPGMELRELGSVSRRQLQQEYREWKEKEDKYRERLRD